MNPFAAPSAGAPVAWVCDDPKCIPLAKVVYHMTTKDLTYHEVRAVVAASDKAGAFLDSIGKTDLASLTETEWLKLWQTFLKEYSADMRERITSHAAPF